MIRSSLSGTVLALALSVAAPAMAAERLDGPLAAQVTRIIDGDTLAVSVAVWLGQRITTTVRIQGIDAPELRGRCPAEKDAAKAARSRLAALTGPNVVLSGITADKYGGRVLAKVTLPDGRDAAATLIAEGHARPYQGGKRQPWCGAK